MGCCQGSRAVQTLEAYKEALQDIQEAAYAAVDAAADLVFEESSEDEDALHKKNPDCLYLVFLDKKGEEHGVAFYRQGLGMTLTEWSDNLKVAGFYKTDVNEVVSPAEERGVQIGWSLIRIGHIDVSEMQPTDAVNILREKELCLMQHRSVKPWVQVVTEDKSKTRVERHVVDVQGKHTVMMDAFITSDPRGAGYGDVSVVAFHYPGFKTRVDRMCQASFLSNFHDSGSAPFMVHDAFHGTEGKTFSNAECAFLAMEVWDYAEELRYSGPEDARKIVNTAKTDRAEQRSLVKASASASTTVQTPSASTTSKLRFGKEEVEFGEDLGYKTRLRALLAVLRAKFHDHTDLGLALMGTGSAFLLYYPADTEASRTSRKGKRMSSKDGGVPVSEAAFDEPGLPNTLGLLLMYIRYELGAEDGGWGEWLEESCSVSEILDDGADSSVEFGKLVWNTAVVRCVHCVEQGLKRSKEPPKEKQEELEEAKEERTSVQVAVVEAPQVEQAVEVVVDSNAEPDWRHAADAGISIYTPTWDLNPQGQLHGARETKKSELEVKRERSREKMASLHPVVAPPPPSGTMQPAEVNTSAAAEAFLGDALFSATEMSNVPALVRAA
mmetsp:Transcript_43797/g.101169  ORF Transcript_43797/g.101169 Transcript_43797/m.101169 type:complete len:610 (-) Transcript_43797:128-1957(-)